MLLKPPQSVAFCYSKHRLRHLVICETDKLKANSERKVQKRFEYAILKLGEKIQTGAENLEVINLLIAMEM